jgi:hypothetical protein
MTSTGQNRPENAFKEIDSWGVKTELVSILKNLYGDEDSLPDEALRYMARQLCRGAKSG